MRLKSFGGPGCWMVSLGLISATVFLNIPNLGSPACFCLPRSLRFLGFGGGSPTAQTCEHKLRRAREPEQHARELHQRELVAGVVCGSGRLQQHCRRCELRCGAAATT